jgi:hypothetical protein
VELERSAFHNFNFSFVGKQQQTALRFIFLSIPAETAQTLQSFEAPGNFCRKGVAGSASIKAEHRPPRFPSGPKMPLSCTRLAPNGRQANEECSGIC